MNPKKTQSGMPLRFTADFHNKLVDTVKWAQRQQTLGGAGQHKFRSNATNVFVKNATGSDLPAFSVIELTGKLHAETDFIWNKSLNGEEVTALDTAVAITQNPSATGELVESVVAGTTIALINVISTSHKYADVTVGSTVLKSGESGRFRIVHPLTATGSQKAMVRFEGGGSSSEQKTAQVRNDSGYTVPEFGFLMVDGVVTTPTQDLASFKAAPVFRGIAPQSMTVFGNKRLVSVPGGAAPGETVDCILDGRVPARVYSEYKTGPLMAHLNYESSINDVSRLNARYDQTNFGFPILYRETGTGEKWALIDLMPQNQPAVIIGEATLTTGMFAGGSVALNSPFSYQGNPWSTSQLWQNGIVRTLATPTSLKISGPSAWIGEATVTIKITYSELPLAGSSGFYRVPGFRAIWSLLFPPAGFEYGFNEAVEISEKPGLVSGADYLGVISSGGSSGTYYSLTQPIFFQSGPGALAKNGADIFSTLSVQLLGGTGSGRITVTPVNCSLFLHEVDPMLDRFGQSGGGVIPVGGYLSSGAVADPLAPLKEGVSPATGALYSNGLRTVTPGSGFGFE
jgi:hypothetical protein